MGQQVKEKTLKTENAGIENYEPPLSLSLLSLISTPIISSPSFDHWTLWANFWNLKPRELEQKYSELFQSYLD